MAILVLSTNDDQWTIPAGTVTTPHQVKGTTGIDRLIIETGANVKLSQNFDKGVDDIKIDGSYTDFSVARDGGEYSLSVILTDTHGTTITMPAGTHGQSLSFNNGVIDLWFDPTAGKLMLGTNDAITTNDQVITSTSSLVTVTPVDHNTSTSIDVGTPIVSAIIDAGSGNYNFKDNATVLTNVTINNFTSGDIITATGGAAADYTFSRVGASDVRIESNLGGVVNTILLTGVATAAGFITNEATFESIVGWDAFRIEGSVATVSVDVGLLQTPITFNAANGSFNYTDDGTMPNNVIISNFTNDDKITVSNTGSDKYNFTSDGADVIISFNKGGIVSLIQLTGVLSLNAGPVADETGFETAIGHDAFFTVV